jgi:hypothetical protein
MSSETIETWHRPGRYYARQGAHQVSTPFEGDAVRDGGLRRALEAQVRHLLVKAKQAQQQLRRPPAPDSRPRRCHAKIRGDRLVCRLCRMSWSAVSLAYPACGGDK